MLQLICTLIWSVFVILWVLWRKIKKAFHGAVGYILVCGFLFGWAAMAFAVSRVKPLETVDKLSLGMSVAALSGTLFTAIYTLRKKPDVRLVEGKYPSEVHCDTFVPIVFYNGGTIPTYVTIIETSIDEDELLVDLVGSPFGEVGGRAYLKKDIHIRTRQGDDVASNVLGKVMVKYLYWRGYRPITCQGIVIVNVQPRV